MKPAQKADIRRVKKELTGKISPGAGSGIGDMLKSTYDTDNDGKVDDSDKLDGQHAAGFAQASHTHAGGDITSQVGDSDKVDGQHAAAFAAAAHNHDTAYVKLTDYEDADVLTKIKNVDGSLSGLDADKLDGNEATAFAAATHSHPVVSTSANGFIAQLPDDQGKFYNGKGSWVELVAAAGQIVLWSAASNNGRHNNITEHTVMAISETKYKEITFNEPAKNIRIKWQMKAAEGDTIYGVVYVNGVRKSNWFSSISTTYETFTYDLTQKLNSGDKVQIYCYLALYLEPGYVANMQLFYDRAICGFGNYTLITPLTVNEFTDYNTTDSDPA